MRSSKSLLPAMKSEKAIYADSVLEQNRLLTHLEDYDPCVVSSVHAGLDIKDSDIDIICYYRNQRRYVQHLQTLPYFEEHISYKVLKHYVLIAFNFGGMSFEIYACDTPVKEQNAFKHFSVMTRLVALGGTEFQSSVRTLKKQGMKTEPAMAAILGLSGNPYDSVLNLYDCADSQLAALLQKRSGANRITR